MDVLKSARSSFVQNVTENMILTSCFNNQVISLQVITGEQSKKYCKTLLAPFERHDSEFPGGVPIEKTNIDSLNLPCHKAYILRKLKCYIE